MNEEAWVYGVVKDYEYCVKKYPEKVKEFSSVKKEWQGLTGEEVFNLPMYQETREMYQLARAIEAKLKEKNT